MQCEWRLRDESGIQPAPGGLKDPIPAASPPTRPAPCVEPVSSHHNTPTSYDYSCGCLYPCLCSLRDESGIQPAPRSLKDP
jgi:hypothetical protein